MPDFINFQLDYYVGSVFGTFTRDGNSIVGGGVNMGVPNPVSLAVSITVGHLNVARTVRGQTTRFFEGYGGMAAGGYLVAGGGVMWSPGNGTATAYGLGVGFQASGVKSPATVGLGYGVKQGYYGTCW